MSKYRSGIHIMRDEFKGKDLVELIELLEPVSEPAPISMLPQTMAWAILAILFLIFCLFLYYRWHQRHKANAYRRAALKAISHAGDDPAVLAGIIRRTALCAYPRKKVSRLHGKQWLEFLDQAYAGSEFNSESGSVIASAPYKSAGSSPELASLVANWVKQHKVNLESPHD